MSTRNIITKKRKIKLTLAYLIAIFLSIYLTSASNMTVQDLIDSYDFLFYNGTLNVTSQADYMIDTNNNGINDTLIINLTTDALTSGTYKFVVEIDNGDKFIVNDTTKSISGLDNYASINFPTALLSKWKFNYSVRVNVDDYNTIFRKTNVEGNTYSNYESGTNITKITDENINNNLIRINLTINSTQSITTNITVALTFNSSTISRTEEETLSNGLQTISINFDNETVKSTHYSGNFTISKILIGNRLFQFNRNTSIYNYEDFAKTSYIKSIADGRKDTNGNNLSEFLEINFTIIVNSSGVYKLTYDLYDEFNNFVISTNKTQTLATGNQIVQTLVNGSELYKSKIDAPYLIKFAKLMFGEETKDVIFNVLLTNQSFYTDYERPPLPDLKVVMGTLFDQGTNITNITINLSNIGHAPAFNVFLDLFDNTTYNNNKSLVFLSNGEIITYNFNITNSSNDSLITAIADFNNLVDEINESNNIVQNSRTQVVSLKIESITTMYSNSTYRIFEFVILNDGETTVTDVQWQFDAGDGNIINSTINMSSLAVNERAFVYMEYNYSSSGSFNVKANATGLSQSTIVTASLSSTVIVGNATSLNVYDFSVLYQNFTLAVFGFSVNNTGAMNLTNINWSLNTGPETIFANELFGLKPNESIFVFAEYQYPTGGEFNAVASATDGTNSDSGSLSVNVKAIEASNLSVLNISGTIAIFEFIVGNRLSTNLTNVSWAFDTKNSNVINSTMTTTLQPNEEMYVYIGYNFTATGIFNVNATARNGSLSDYRNLTIIV